MSKLSQRGQACIKPLPEYVKRVIVAWGDIYHAENNPSGYIILSIAENMLSLPYVASALASAPPTPVSNLNYGKTAPFAKACAGLLSKYVTRTPVEPSHIAVFNGATSMFDTLTHVLCDPGDGVITTGPGYRGLQDDVTGRAGARFYIASLDDNGDEASPLVTVQAFEKAWQDAGGENSRIRMVIIMSPNNPTGEVLSRELILDIVRWGREKNLHLLFDEVYAQSVYGEGVNFVSVAEVLEGNLGDDIHIVYSFSKDLCLSGTRIGVLYTQNEELLRTQYGFLGFFAGTSRHTQWGVRHILSNDDWLEKFFADNKVRLRNAYRQATTKLDDMQIPYMHADAGFFIWIDLRKWLRGRKAEDEMELWYKLADARVLVTPSCECFGKYFGFFRFCFAAVASEELDIALDRMGTALESCSNI